jgi:hypothetical protein
MTEKTRRLAITVESFELRGATNRHLMGLKESTAQTNTHLSSNLFNTNVDVFEILNKVQYYF